MASTAKTEATLEFLREWLGQLENWDAATWENARDAVKAKGLTMVTIHQFHGLKSVFMRKRATPAERVTKFEQADAGRKAARKLYKDLSSLDKPAIIAKLRKELGKAFAGLKGQTIWSYYAQVQRAYSARAQKRGENGHSLRNGAPAINLDEVGIDVIISNDKCIIARDDLIAIAKPGTTLNLRRQEVEKVVIS